MAAVSQNHKSETKGAGPQLHTIAGVSAEWGISKRSVWRLIAAGELKPVRIGRSVRIRAADMEALVARGGTSK